MAKLTVVRRDLRKMTKGTESMQSLRIALYPGDGIGKEVLAEAVRVLDHVQRLCGDFELHKTLLPWGADYYFAHGQVVPDDYLEQLRRFDAILLGALGDPGRLPDHVTLAPIVQIRQHFDQYVCMRPVKLYPGVPTPLVNPGRIDMVVLRENTEGEYIVCGGRAKLGSPDEVAIQTGVHTRSGVERILRFGYELARKRRKRLTMITKSNALVFAYVLWDDVLEAVQRDYQDVESRKLYADAAAMDFVRRPIEFDVVVASNLFGDLLTDLSSVIVGGLGLAASSNINPERRFPSMFEPVHGSAPDIAGRGIANPAAAILSGAMMLEWFGLEHAAVLIRRGVEQALERRLVTPDLGGELSTVQMSEAILACIDG